MNIKRKIVEALVRLYPARWRREYGAEFADVVAARPLGPRAVLDIVWNALRQQGRLGEPWILVAVPLLAFNLCQWSLLVLYPPPYQQDSFTGNWIASTLGSLLLAGVGYWTVIRNGPEARGGRAALKASLLINSPLSLIALLAAIGLLRIVTVGPGDPTSTFLQHGFALTLYDHARRPPALFGMFVMPLLGLPESLFWGWLGGRIARAVLHGRWLLYR